mgnify:CR=1 FL=1
MNENHTRRRHHRGRRRKKKAGIVSNVILVIAVVVFCVSGFQLLKIGKDIWMAGASMRRCGTWR